MGNVYDSIITGLTEAIDDAKVSRLSQKLFASYMDVSAKAVEAWESGINNPSEDSKQYSKHDGNE